MNTNYLSTILLLPCNGIDQGTTLTDFSPIQNKVNLVGLTKTQTSVSKFYSSSVYFDGSGSGISIPYSSVFDLGTNDFTISFWVYCLRLTDTQMIFSSNTNWTTPGYIGFRIYADGHSSFLYYESSSKTLNTAAGTFVLNTWQNVVITRQSNVLNVYVDNTLKAGISVTSTFNSNTNFSIGLNNDLTESFKGYLQDFTIYKGTGQYQSSEEYDYDFTGNTIDTNSWTLYKKLSSEEIIQNDKIQLAYSTSGMSCAAITNKIPISKQTSYTIISCDWSPSKRTVDGYGVSYISLAQASASRDPYYGTPYPNIQIKLGNPSTDSISRTKITIGTQTAYTNQQVTGGTVSGSWNFGTTYHLEWTINWSVGIMSLKIDANKFPGDKPVDLVIIKEWNSKIKITEVIPDTTGYWSTLVPSGQYEISYIANGYTPRTHGPYNV